MANQANVITFEDDQAFRQLSYSWATSYDTKNWDLLSSICTKEVQTLYSALDARLGDKTVPKEDYISSFSSDASLGDKRVRTQHLLGAVHFEKTGSDEAVGHWQIQAAHYRTLADGSVKEWISASYVDHIYERVGGQWKFGGLRPHTKLWERGHVLDVIGQFD
ncbi:scytalone dehydratase-2 [Elsinoe australis]|uniref:Scytalone dehydratase-2 n=1 Tax=Elsinoe australis TaxID=40998 RepID=A0A4V6DTU3_9PEZI|nr:scytalone dehydratase-2 [Elsinoe australis]